MVRNTEHGSVCFLLDCQKEMSSFLETMEMTSILFEHKTSDYPLKSIVGQWVMLRDKVRDSIESMRGEKQSQKFGLRFPYNLSFSLSKIHVGDEGQ